MGKTIADWHKKYFPFVFRRCLKILKNTHDAEDAAQDVFVRLVRMEGRGNKLDKINNEEGLLWTYATNLCLSRLEERKRKQGKNITLFEESIPAAGDDFEKIDAKLLLQSLFENVEGVSEETRLYCYMYYYDRMKLGEIAETVGKSITWVHRKITDFVVETRRKLGEALK